MSSDGSVLVVRSRSGARFASPAAAGVAAFEADIGTALDTTSSSTSLPTMETVPPSFRLNETERE